MLSHQPIWVRRFRIHDLGSIVMIEVVRWVMVLLPCRLFSADNDEVTAFWTIFAPICRRGAVAEMSNPRAYSPDSAQTLLLGSIAAVVDIAFLASFLPFIIRLFESLGEWIGMVGGLALVILVVMIGGYPIYRLVHWGLSKLHINRLRTAPGLAQLLSWLVPTYILLVALA